MGKGLGHVFFKADDYRLDSTSYRTLFALATFMKRHPSLKIEIGGHTNLRPGERFEVPANSHFDIQTAELLDYVCHFA